MTKRYKTLQKKLQELEAELSLVFSLPAEATTPYHHLLSEGIEQRFVFLKNLLSAEIASHPSKPRHLHHIAQRLTEIEIAFREWDDYRTSAVNNFDTASICSCNESCRNDDGEAAASDLPYPDLGSFEDEVQQNSPGGLVDVKVQEGTEKAGTDVVDEKKEGRISVLWKYCGVLISGMILGTLLMGAAMIGDSGSSYSTLHEGFLIPT